MALGSAARQIASLRHTALGEEMLGSWRLALAGRQRPLEL